MSPKEYQNLVPTQFYQKLQSALTCRVEVTQVVEGFWFFTIGGREVYSVENNGNYCSWNFAGYCR